MVILDILMEKFIFMSNRVIEKHRYLRNQHSLYWEEIMLSRVTDLALEVRESFPDDNVEISGVKIIKRDTGISGIFMTEVEIKDEHGMKAMGKPVGKYITLEFSDREWEKSDETGLEKVLAGLWKALLLKK